MYLMIHSRCTTLPNHVDCVSSNRIHSFRSCQHGSATAAHQPARPTGKGQPIGSHLARQPAILYRRWPAANVEAEHLDGAYTLGLTLREHRCPIRAGHTTNVSEDPPPPSSASALLHLVRQHFRFDSGAEAPDSATPRSCSRSNRGTSTHRRTGHTRERLHVQVRSRGSSITSSAVTWSLLGVFWCVRSQEGSVISSSQELWSQTNPAV
jgi:hypothetical protein